jgi:putative heme-binding domain-containing protein
LRASSVKDDADSILKLMTPDQPIAIQSAAAEALRRFDSAQFAQPLLAEWARYSPQVRSQIIEALLTQTASATRLLDALEEGVLEASDLSAAQRQRLLDHRSGAVRQRAEKLLATAIDANRQHLIDRFSHLSLSGDPGRGLAVFEKRCATCHRWGDRGQDVGPDLAALSDRLPDRMLIAIFDPNRAVEARYVSYTATTHEGLSHTGILGVESETSITLIKPEGKRESLLRSEIEELRSSGKSLMPEGLENELAPQDVADLLSMLGGAPETR